MDVPKLFVILVVMLVASFLLIDVTVNTITNTELQQETEKALMDSMRNAIHLGDLRMGNVTIVEEKFKESMEMHDLKSVQIISVSPPLVAVEMNRQRENLSQMWVGDKTTSMTVKVAGIADLREEGGR